MKNRITVFLDTKGYQGKIGEILFKKTDEVINFNQGFFTYADEYINDKGAFAISPELPIIKKIFPLTNFNTGLVGAFADTAPDKWGRGIINKRTQKIGLTDFEYLLNVYDSFRQGALRFSFNDGISFELHEAKQVAMNKELESVTKGIYDYINERNIEKAANKIFATGGASNGGQFPKVNMMTDGELCLLKFETDTSFNKPHWEAVALSLAHLCDINACVHELLWKDGKSIIKTKRFDRFNDGNKTYRIPYLSAKSFLQINRHSLYVLPYNLFAEEVLRRCGKKDAEELLKRVSFNILINNIDDHYKNYGFLHDGKGWHLSPLFDCVPTTLADPEDIIPVTNSLKVKRSLLDLYDSCAAYGVDKSKAKDIILRQNKIIQTNFEKLAKRNQIKSAEIREYKLILELHKKEIEALV
jgi:serine/threonine-protein kinase HipA